MHNSGDTNNITIFVEEIKKRVNVATKEIEQFLQLWDYREFRRNEFIIRAGEIPRCSIFVLKGCLRQFVVNDAGAESIVYFAEERHFIGDMPALRNNLPSDFNIQAIEACTL